MEKLTHYRATKDNRFLGSWDLVAGEVNGKPKYKEIIVEIEKIGIQEEIENHQTNSKDIKNVVYFKNGIKPMVLNATNTKMIATATGTPFMEKWANAKVLIYVETGVYMPGTKKADNITTDALRIKPVPKRLCDVCGKVISEEIYQGSMQKYGKALCSKECLEKAGV